MNDSSGRGLYRDPEKQVAAWQEDQPDSEELVQQHQCPNCGGDVSSTADICENCGEWLLKGQCNFCYAEVEAGQKFCSECGNPPEGIVCYECGQLSHFDFCPNCDISLTEQAQETLELIRNSAEIQSLFHVSDNEVLGVNADDEALSANEQVNQSEAEMEKLKDYMFKLFPEKLPSASTPKPKRQEGFELKSNATANLEENLKAVQQSEENIKDAEQKAQLQQQKERQAARLMEEIRSKTFSSNQEARKFFGALKIVIVTEVQKQIPKGWRCNVYGVAHNSPYECSATGGGGIWLFEIITEKGFKEIEI